LEDTCGKVIMNFDQATSKVNDIISRICQTLKFCRDEDVRYLSLIIHRVPVKVVSASVLPEKLISDCYGTCTHINSDRIQVYVIHGSEPPIACAAQTILNSEDGKYLKALQQLKYRLDQGLVNVGDMGELVCAISHIITYDMLCFGPKGSEMNLFFQTFTILEYLEALLGDKRDFYKMIYSEKSGGDKNKKSKDFSKLPLSIKNVISAGLFTALVSLSHFAYYEKINMVSLRDALLRGAGIIPPEGFKGVDLIIPFVLDNGRISAIFEQVKNWNGLVSYNQITQSYTNMQNVAIEIGLDPSSVIYLFRDIRQGQIGCRDRLMFNRKNQLYISGFPDQYPAISHFGLEEVLISFLKPSNQRDDKYVKGDLENTLPHEYKEVLLRRDSLFSSYQEETKICVVEGIPEEPLID
jgi:hypothetical protein